MTNAPTLRQARRLARRVRIRAVSVLPDPVREPIESALDKRRVRAGYNTPYVNSDELKESYAKAIAHLTEAGAPVGDYLEFGVCHGTSMKCMNDALTEAGQSDYRLFGFDSFEGLPPEADTDDEGVWSAGQFDSDEEYTRELLTKGGIDWGRTELVVGWYSDTLNEQLMTSKDMSRKAGVVMVDCDMYLSAKDSLDFCVEAMADHAVVFFDDWFSGGDLAERNLGEKRAFDEFLAENPQFTAEERPDLRYGRGSNVYIVRRN